MTDLQDQKMISEKEILEGVNASQEEIRLADPELEAKQTEQAEAGLLKIDL